MTKYFAQDTPQAGLERMMMSVPGFQKRGSGMMILSRFCYKPEDVACRYCLHYRRRSCQVPICPLYRRTVAVRRDWVPRFDSGMFRTHSSCRPTQEDSGCGALGRAGSGSPCAQYSSNLKAVLRTWHGMTYLPAIWRRSTFSPQRSGSGNRHYPLFHTNLLISATSRSTGL